MLNYESLSKELSERIEHDNLNGSYKKVAFNDSDVIRRNPGRDEANVWRTAFIRDVDKIINCPFYNRYADKTQVFSFYKNDDVTRRGLHVQLVSRIARTIGNTLRLNLDLIEAIALGHDIGHTPFGHYGESCLDNLLFSHIGRHFSHNIHSVRVLDGVYPYNISLQTLNGIASHDGEFEQSEYKPKPMFCFKQFDDEIESCYKDKSNVRKLMPSTLEGCVVRISDMIAYLGKDRQDAIRTKLVKDDSVFVGCTIGKTNAEIIHNLIVNIIENSYGKDFIMLDEQHFEALMQIKKDNYEKIYLNKDVQSELDRSIMPMMSDIYEKLLFDIKSGNTDSVIFRQHLNYVNLAHYERVVPYEDTEPNQIVVDYIASMTDDYFIDLYRYLFPRGKYGIKYHGYFD